MTRDIAPPEAAPPIRRTVVVRWDPATAFARFTAGFGEWWPRSVLSIGGDKVRDIVFECRDGGLIVEELKDGRRFQWGRVTAFDPPHRVAFNWHPSQNEDQAQLVEITFLPDTEGTRVELVSSGWERLGTRGRRERRGYDLGWQAVLGVYAGRRTVGLAVMSAFSTLATGWLRLRGRLESSIDEAGGRLPPAGA